MDDFEINAARAAADIIATAIQERGGCLIALSGGRTPCGVYRRLGELLVTRAVDLSRFFLIFVDERMVPPEDSDSNFGMIGREFLSRLPIPLSQVHRIRGELQADEAARDYEQRLEAVWPIFGGRCDLILLGVGGEGHTASLFPGTEALRERHHPVQAVFVPRLGSWRVTLTLPVINRARAVFFLATGVEKAAIVSKILTTTHPCEDIPATLVHPDSGTLTWMIDTEAASQLPSGRLFKPNPMVL